MDGSLALSGPRQRRRAAASPLGVWARAALLFAAIGSAAIAYFAHVGAPVTFDPDRAHFAQQIERLQQAAAAVESTGADPLTFMFIGNSRTKNVAFDAAQVARAAKEAGLDQPVVSSVLAVNWGGFERLEQAIAGLEQAKPDYVVIMPEVLYLDFNAWFRIRIGFRFLQQKMRRREFVFFEPEKEFGEPVCLGFDESIEERLNRRRLWVEVGVDNDGPRAAAAAIRRLAANGTTIYLAEIPSHPRLTKLKHDGVDHRALLAMHGLDRIPNIRLLVGRTPVPADAYCDYAHIAPDKAELWLRQLFAAIARDR